MTTNNDRQRAVECLREVRALLESTPSLQGREYIDLGIRFNDAINYFAALRDEAGEAVVAWPTKATHAGSGDWHARTALCHHSMSEAQAQVWNACLAACKQAVGAARPAPQPEVTEDDIEALWSDVWQHSNDMDDDLREALCALRDALAAKAGEAGGEVSCETCEGQGEVVTYNDPYDRGDVSSPNDPIPCPDCSHPTPKPAEPAVPEPRYPVGGANYGWQGEYNRGWNDCRAAMLTAAQQEATPPGAKGVG